MTGDCSIFNRVLLPYLPIYKRILSSIFSHAYFKRKVFFHQISKEKSAAYYIRARAIVGQIRYSVLDLDNFQVRLQYWVASLCNQLLPEFSSNQFETFHRCHKHIEDVHVTFSRQENKF